MKKVGRIPNISMDPVAIFDDSGDMVLETLYKYSMVPHSERSALKYCKMRSTTTWSKESHP